MAGTFTNLLYHIVFSTKDRRKLISPDLQPELQAYVGGIIRGESGHALAIGGVSDHLHIVAKFAAEHAVSEMLQHIKGNSSRWVHEVKAVHALSWQEGDAAFTVSESQLKSVIRYVEGQAEHHKKQSFQEELLVLLAKNNIAFDERYIWK